MKNDMKNFGIGCGTFILVAAVLALALPEKYASSVLAFATLLSIPAFGISFFLKQFDRIKWYVWGGTWALSLLLGLTVQIPQEEKQEKPQLEEQRSEKEKESKTAQKDAPPRRTLDEALA